MGGYVSPSGPSGARTGGRGHAFYTPPFQASALPDWLQSLPDSCASVHAGGKH